MRHLKCIAALAVASLAAPALAEQAPFTVNVPFYDFGVNGTGVSQNPGQAGIAPAPILDNNPASAAAVDSFLAARSSNPSLILAVKIREPLTDSAALNIFNKYKIQYVFADFEDAAAVGRTRALADQMLASRNSKNAYVGNFNFYPNASSDRTRPASYSSSANSFQSQYAPTDNGYSTARGNIGSSLGKQYAAPALYPGAPDYKTSAAAGSPNVRAALFTLPIVRETYATNGLLGRAVPTGGTAAYDTSFTGFSGGAQNIPYVTRFNNWGNSAYDTDGNPNNGYRFVSNDGTAGGANGQLLSRGDFQAMILHYRLRGADSVHLFNLNSGSVLDLNGNRTYTATQEQSDVINGWKASRASTQSPALNGIFSRNQYAFANLSTVIGDQGGTSGDTSPRNIEVAGAVWSGVFDRSSVGTRHLAILLSNLSAVQKTIDLPNAIGGFPTARNDGVAMDDFFLDPGQHKLVTFTLNGGKWRVDSGINLTGNAIVFTDNNRNGIGIPEPTTLGLLGVGALGLLVRRRRTA